MENATSSHPYLITLNFGDLLSLRYLYFTIALFGFVLILAFNGVVIMTIALHRQLHAQMYTLISVLCFNGAYGSCAFFPALTFALLQQAQVMSYNACLTQVFMVHTYLSCEFTILTAMAYDRYICICKPLRYNSIMSASTVRRLIAGAWLYPGILVGINLILTIRLPLCSSRILKIYCDNWSVVRLSCVDSNVNNVYGLFLTAIMAGLMPLLIFYSYIEILKVCVKYSKKVRDQALQTCFPHLVAIINLIIDCLFEILLYRFTPTTLPYELRVVMSVQFFIVPPLLNPLIYGIKLKEIKSRVICLFQRKGRT